MSNQDDISPPPRGSTAGLGILQLHLFLLFAMGVVLVRYGGPVNLLALWPPTGAFIIGVVFYWKGTRARFPYLILLAASVIAPMFWLFIRVAGAG